MKAIIEQKATGLSDKTNEWNSEFKCPEGAAKKFMVEDVFFSRNNC